MFIRCFRHLNQLSFPKIAAQFFFFHQTHFHIMPLPCFCIQFEQWLLAMFTTVPFIPWNFITDSPLNWFPILIFSWRQTIQTFWFIFKLITAANLQAHTCFIFLHRTDVQHWSGIAVYARALNCIFNGNVFKFENSMTQTTATTNFSYFKLKIPH